MVSPTECPSGPGAGLGRGEFSLDMVNLRGLSAMLVETAPRCWLETDLGFICAQQRDLRWKQIWDSSVHRCELRFPG